MYTVKIKKTRNPDEGWTDKDELFIDTIYHRDAVEDVMRMVTSYLEDIGEKHDWSKLEYFDEFANDCLERQDTPDFKSRNWYHIHTTKERHHVNAHEPADVDLFDILELIIDCICAGKARSGEVNTNFLILKEGILDRAYWNTIKKISEYVMLEE